MSDLIIPDSRFSMPGLFYPGRKPVGNVKIDFAHHLARRMLYSLSPCGRYDLVTGRTTDKKAGLNFTVENVGQVVGSSGEGEGVLYLNRELDFSVDEPFSIFYTSKKFDTSNNGMITGRGAPLNSYLWENEGSNFTVKTESNGNVQFPAASSFVFSAFHSVLITSDGGGVSGGNVSLYLNGDLVEVKNGVSFDLTINRVMAGYLNAFEYTGYLRDFDVFGECLSARAAKSLHENPYQFLIPA